MILCGCDVRTRNVARGPTVEVAKLPQQFKRYTETPHRVTSQSQGIELPSSTRLLHGQGAFEKLAMVSQDDQGSAKLRTLLASTKLQALRPKPQTPVVLRFEHTIEHVLEVRGLRAERGNDDCFALARTGKLIKLICCRS